jgi:hypothetical protein
LSLVRNNAGTGAGAVGFLRDSRRMNVALSRAKGKLVIVGSLQFLEEAVRGVNPGDNEHDLTFLTKIVRTIRGLARKKITKDVMMASVVGPQSLSADGDASC